MESTLKCVRMLCLAKPQVESLVEPAKEKVELQYSPGKATASQSSACWASCANS